jgi:HlyD family secretion protein
VRRRTRSVRTAGAVLGLLAGCGGDPDELLLVGSVERTLVELTAPAAESIVALPVSRGQRVSAGDVLVQLDKTYALAEIARAEANVASARTAVFVAEQELERARALRRTSVASQQQLERAELARDEAGARLREAEAMAVAAQKRTRDLDLVSPVDGVVDQLPFDAGERVPLGSVLAVVLADGNPWVRVWVPETSYVRVLPGTPAQVRIDGVDGVLRGSVLDVARESEFTPHYALTERDRRHLVYETRVELLDAPEILRPGMPAEVRILAPASVVRAAPSARATP